MSPVRDTGGVMEETCCKDRIERIGALGLSPFILHSPTQGFHVSDIEGLLYFIESLKRTTDSESVTPEE